MRLAASAIKREIQNGNLTFNPPVNQELIVDSSVDLRLSDTFYSYEPVRELGQSGVVGAIDLRRYEFANFIRRFGRKIIVPDDEYFEIPLNQLILGFTTEAVRLPQHLGGRIEGKSSYARIGLMVHITAPTIHPGFNNNIMLELYNLGRLPIRVWPGEPICQLILERVEGEGMYQGQFQS